MTGTATFDRVPTTASGLNYAGIIARPMRGTVVQVRSSDGTRVLYQSQTDASGQFSITAPASTTVLVTAISKLGTPSSVTTQVVNNLSSDAIYSVYTTKTTGVASESGVDIHAASGWTGAAYGASRASAPFAILDTAYAAQQLIRSANASATFPLLTIGWSTGNSTAAIGTSNYNPGTGRLSILGSADEDTDEFDTHVVAHEWGHWFESTFSRSDNLGGSHGAGDILDETVAFGEGWGNAFSGMVNRDPNYYDTQGAAQATTGVNLALEANAIPNTSVFSVSFPRRLDGGWSETTVQELLWDCFDGGGAVADTDADGVALGFTPLYNVFVGAQKTTPGFTSIYSFMYYLKDQNPVSSSGIAALEALENIGPHDQFEQTSSGFRRYTEIPNNGAALTTDIDGDPLTTYIDYGPIAASAGNKLYNRLLFYATAPATGTYRVRVTPSTSTHDVVLRRGGGATPIGVDDNIGGPEVLNFSATSGQLLVFSVGSFATATNPTGVTPFQIQFGTPAQVGKPTAPVVVTPNADG